MALALVVIEEHARRTVHLRDDDALGAVDDERAVRRHEGHVAHVDVLLLDVLDRLGAGVGIDIEHDQAQRHLERRGEGHAALAALVDVIFRRLEFVFHEFEQSGVRKIRNRENRLEHGLQSLVGTPALGLVDQQELIVGGLLHFDQIGHFRDFADMTEKFANTLTAGERLRHIAPRTFMQTVQAGVRQDGPSLPAVDAGHAASPRPLPRKFLNEATLGGSAQLELRAAAESPSRLVDPARERFRRSGQPGARAPGPSGEQGSQRAIPTIT